VSVVLDASVLVDALLVGVSLPEREEWHAPDLVDVEVLSALRRTTLTGSVTPSDARDALDTHLAFQIRRHGTRRLLPRMWALRHDIIAADASYVALAESLGAALVTTDLRLARVAVRYCDVVTP